MFGWGTLSSQPGFEGLVGQSQTSKWWQICGSFSLLSGQLAGFWGFRAHYLPELLYIASIELASPKQLPQEFEPSDCVPALHADLKKSCGVGKRRTWQLLLPKAAQGFPVPNLSRKSFAPLCIPLP